MMAADKRQEKSTKSKYTFTFHCPCNVLFPIKMYESPKRLKYS